MLLGASPLLLLCVIPEPACLPYVLEQIIVRRKAGAEFPICESGSSKLTVADSSRRYLLRQRFLSFAMDANPNQHRARPPVPTSRFNTRAGDPSVASKVPSGTTRSSSFGTSGPAPAKISHSSTSQRAASVIRFPRRAERFVVAVEFSGTGYFHGSRSHCHTGSSAALHGALMSGTSMVQ